jgi:hypothetical protein
MFDFGNLQITGKDMTWPVVKFDRLAFDEQGRLQFVSVIADAGIIKGIRGALNTDKKVTIAASGVDAERPGGRTLRVGNLEKFGTYRDDTFRLGYNAVHAFFMTKATGFLISASDANLWRELNDVRFTTPLLPDWLPYIKTKLIEGQLLRYSFAYRCECATLACTTKDLDALVTEGVRSRMLTIPDERNEAA